jgi:SAM-dependent methyltransferase
MLRILMNRSLGDETLRGKVVDIGGGRNPDYFDYFKKEGDIMVEPIDGSLSGIDFETDAVPHADGSIDTVILCNVLEHVYNYEHLLAEVRRIMKADGQLIGFVPFWIGYHPDPRDFFRYTKEALERIFKDVGFSDARIRAIGGGPILANFNTIVLSLPRFARPLLYLWYAPLDWLFVRLRPRSKARNPLGFLFVVRK